MLKKGAQRMNDDLQSVKTWAEKWLVNFNAHKTKCMNVSNRNVANHPPTLF